MLGKVLILSSRNRLTTQYRPRIFGISDDRETPLKFNLEIIPFKFAPHGFIMRGFDETPGHFKGRVVDPGAVGGDFGFLFARNRG